MERLLVIIDYDADIIEVPMYVINNKEQLRLRFLRWLYNRFIRHKYWVKSKTGIGYRGVRYRSDAFVEWLNKKVLDKSEERAAVLQEHVTIEDYKNELPSIFF